VLAQRELARAIGRSGGDVVVASLSMTWVATRAAGYTAFALLTASVALGLLLSSPLRPTRWPRFATTELHRFVTLVTLVFIAIHVLVALLDSFIGFSLSDVLVPFTSNYRPVWMGLGIVSAYLAAALWASSWLQRRIGYRWWRRLHLGTFGVYVGASVHGIGAGSDTGWAWSWTIYLASFALVGALVVLRLPDRAGRTPAPSRASRPGTAVSGPGLAASGPRSAASTVAAEAAAGLGGTPGVVAVGQGLVADRGFSARIQGRLWQGPDGAGGAVVQLEGALRAGFDGSFQLRVQGWIPPGSSQLRVTDNHLWIRNRDGVVWWGRIDVFNGMHLRGVVTAERPGTRPLALEIELFGFAGEAVDGVLRATPGPAASGPPASGPPASSRPGHRHTDGGPGPAPSRVS
jgi:methionine sulfoxide reductase heme-binding subunit